MGLKDKHFILGILLFVFVLAFLGTIVFAHTGHEESHDYMGGVVSELGLGELCQPVVVKHHLKKWAGSAHGKSKIHRDEVHQTLLATAGFTGAERCKTALKEVLGDLKYRISCHYVKDKEKRNILCSAK